MAIDPLTLGIGFGAAQGALNLFGGIAGRNAQADAVMARNRSIERAAKQTRTSRLAQQKFAYRQQRGNVGAQANSMAGALAATSAARGISGSRTANALQSNNLAQAGLALEDLAVSNLFANNQIQLEYANMMNQRGGFAGQSTGLALLGAGFAGLGAGLNAYGVFSS